MLKENAFSIDLNVFVFNKYVFFIAYSIWMI